MKKQSERERRRLRAWRRMEGWQDRSMGRLTLEDDVSFGVRLVLVIGVGLVIINLF